MRRDWFWMLMRKLGVQARPAVAGVESRAALAADTTPETV
jgi:hypothetical protein